MSRTTNPKQDNISDKILWDLWRSRIDTLIGAIANNEQYYREIANASVHISAEYHGRFLIELIQNANDQAFRGSKTGSVIVVRTNDLVVVGNIGEPFDAKKVDEITSIFLSSKSVDECIGNKGIGFKAVFQVTDTVEIYSSSKNQSLKDNLNIGFQVTRNPFENEIFHQQFLAITEAILEEQPHRVSEIDQRFAGLDVTATILEKAKLAAGFKFPVPVSMDDFSSICDELGPHSDEIQNCQTLVVLRVDPNDTNVTSMIETAISELAQNDPSESSSLGASLLFLGSLDHIKVIDCVDDFSVEIVRKKPELDEHDGAVKIQRVEVSISISDSLENRLPSNRESQKWWLAKQDFGTNPAEVDQLRQSIDELHLPEANWKNVKSAPVTVAIPIQQGVEDSIGLPANGKFCIGLPTQMRTGSPVWVNAPFHGTISRTEVNLKNEYNKLLFGKAILLAGNLANRFKSDEDFATKRLATLMLLRDSGPVSNEFYSATGLASEAMVLTDDGNFVHGSSILMPEEKDIEFFLRLAATVDRVSDFGFSLPEQTLLLHARSVLDDLCKESAVPLTQYIERNLNGLSLLETAAKNERFSGESFWDAFLTWVVGKQWPNNDEIRQQAIIPVGSSDLAKASSKVFFRPYVKSNLTAVANEDEKGADDELELTEIDETISVLLKFFDEKALRVRRPNSKAYTDVGSLISDRRLGLVGKPRYEDLLNQAVIPALSTAGENGENDKAVRLLHQAVIWLQQTTKKALRQIKTEEVLVPGYDYSKRKWVWRSPETVYFGNGWAFDKTNELMSSLFRNRAGALLVPWNDFEKKLRSLGYVTSKFEWLDSLASLGVWHSPRILTLDEKIHVLDSFSYHYLTINEHAKAPTPISSEIWESYLHNIGMRSCQNKQFSHSHNFYLSKVLWVDGFEDEAKRPHIVEAILRNPERYDDVNASQAKLSRWEGADASSVPAVWIHALKHMNWQVFPTHKGLKSSAQAWWVHAKNRSNRRYGYLPSVTSEYSKAKALLGKFGICEIADASIKRLAMALHSVAEQMTEYLSDDQRYVTALVIDIYEQIDQKLKHGEEIPELFVFSRPLPLACNDRLAAARLQDIPFLLVGDDPERIKHVKLPEETWTIPSRIHRSYGSLFNAISGLFPDGKIKRISELKLNITFEPISTPIKFEDYLASQFTAKNILEDIALLIAHCGRKVNPNSSQFNKLWKQFLETHIVFGRFEESAFEVVCFDAYSKGGPILMLNNDATRYDVIASAWRLAGKAYEDTWVRFSDALRKNTQNDFLHSKGISDRERTEIESIIRLGFDQRLQPFDAACLALWRQENKSRPIEDFHDLWKANTRTPEEAGNWLKVENIGEILEQARQQEEPDGSLQLLMAKGIPITEWQLARREMGTEPFVFEIAVSEFEIAKQTIVARLKAMVGYLAVPAASSKSNVALAPKAIHSIQPWIDKIAAFSVPDNIRYGRGTQSESIVWLCQQSLELKEMSGVHDTLSGVIKAVRSLSANPPSNASLIKLKRESDASTEVYRFSSDIDRTQHAKSDMHAIIKVASALAIKLDESVADKAIESDALVQFFIEGCWANRVVAWAAIRYTMESMAPKTASRMKEQRAFRNVDDWQTLWRKFEELKDPPKPPNPKPPVLKYSLLGYDFTEKEFELDAMNGAEGEIAKMLADTVTDDFDIVSLRCPSRNKVNASKSDKKSGGSGAGRGGKRRDDNHLKLLGSIGERFVFQQLKVALPRFDQHCWKSRNKEQFGFDVGDDSLGYDFEYRDVDGTLSGMTGAPLCQIEVKSTTSDGSNGFEMSTNEWDVAYNCHNSDERVYIIFRVGNVATKPIISDILIDPILLRQKGFLDYISKDLFVVVGQRMIGT